MKPKEKKTPVKENTFYQIEWCLIKTYVLQALTNTKSPVFIPRGVK